MKPRLRIYHKKESERKIVDVTFFVCVFKTIFLLQFPEIQTVYLMIQGEPCVF